MPRSRNLAAGCHFAAIVSISSKRPFSVGAYKALLVPIYELSHVTVEVETLKRTAIANA